MPRTKNAAARTNYNPTEKEVVPREVASEEEEEQEESSAEATESDSRHEANSEREIDDSEEQSEVMGPVNMYFSPDQYLAPIKLSAKCYISTAVENLERILRPDELSYFLDHSQFCHFFHMPKVANHKLMGMWMLLVCTANVVKRKSVGLLSMAFQSAFLLENMSCCLV